MKPLIAQLQTLMGGRLASQALGRLGVVGTLLKSLGAPVAPPSLAGWCGDF